jgi:hypothetical protein
MRRDQHVLRTKGNCIKVFCVLRTAAPASYRTRYIPRYARRRRGARSGGGATATLPTVLVVDSKNPPSCSQKQNTASSSEFDWSSSSSSGQTVASGHISTMPPVEGVLSPAPSMSHRARPVQQSPLSHEQSLARQHQHRNVTCKSMRRR